MSTASDRELALSAAGGDAPAFAALVSRHYDRIHRLAWRLTGSPADAEDVAQDVCVKLASAIGTFRGEAEVGTWVWRITYNAAIDFIRARQRALAMAPSEMMQIVDGTGLAAAAADAGDDGDELWAAVQRLSGQQRDAVLLVYGEDMSHAQAAGVLGCTEKTVSWHLHEARKRLKVLLAGSPRPPQPQPARIVPFKSTRGA